MTTHPAAKAALAAMVLDAAPIIASAMTEFDHSPALVEFAYSTAGVRVTAHRPELLEAAFGVLTPAFRAAGWGFNCSFTDNWVRRSVSFQPPHLLTQTGAPVPPFPPR